MKFSKCLVVLGMATIMCSSTVFGATENKKVEATLVTNKVVKDNQQVLEGTELINYNGSLYVPLRKFGEATSITINYKDGVVYLGDNNTISEKTTGTQAVEVREGYGQLSDGGLIYNPEKIENYERFYINATSRVKSGLKDPSSATFDHKISKYKTAMMYTSDGDVVIFGTVRATNSFGGYIEDNYTVLFKGKDYNTIQLVN